MKKLQLNFSSKEDRKVFLDWFLESGESDFESYVENYHYDSDVVVETKFQYDLNDSIDIEINTDEDS